MCTAINITKGIHLFGRTLDVESPYGERVITAPRRFVFEFMYEPPIYEHAAVIGIGIVKNGFPLYFDAVNEHGLAAAGLNFTSSALYRKPADGKHNVPSFELIPWLLTNCKSVTEAVCSLKNVCITDDSISPELPASPLHWMIADRSGSVTVEQTEHGLNIYGNPFGVLTNEPPFPYQAYRVADLRHLGATPPDTRIASININGYSGGMGAIGLPGDFSSSSRFVRAFFAKSNTEISGNAVNCFFHIADTVKVPMGCVIKENGEKTYTRYTSCADAKNMTYHYITYGDRQIRSTSLQAPDGNTLVVTAIE